jgi:hypothetical protein
MSRSAYIPKLYLNDDYDSPWKEFGRMGNAFLLTVLSVKGGQMIKPFALHDFYSLSRGRRLG